MDSKKWEEAADKLASALADLREICRTNIADPYEVYGSVWNSGDDTIQAWADAHEAAGHDKDPS